MTRLPRVKFLNGVVWALMDPRCNEALFHVEDVWKEEGLEVATVTSGREGEHSVNSYHYLGRAFDLRTKERNRLGVWVQYPVAVKERLVRKLYQRLLPKGGWDIVAEKDHIHCEIDRRADQVVQ